VICGIIREKMSVFKKLKGTFQNAHQDIVVGLRALSFSDNQPRQEELDSLAQREINLDAGASLMHRFQNNWSLIHSQTSHSTQQAEEVAKCLSPLFKIWDNHAETASNLQRETKSVSSILATMAQLHALLDDLREDFLAAEEGLDALENICEDLEFRNKCLLEQKKLARYKAKKETEAERLKVNLAYRHAKNAAKIETQKKANLHERAEAFMSVFQDDISYYQKHGHPDRFPPDNSKVSDLGSVELDQDKEPLDSFLGPDEELENTGNLELSGEEAYIEDDYITDYSVKQDLDFIGGAGYSSAAVISEMDMENDGYIYMENKQDNGFDAHDEEGHDPDSTRIPDESTELDDDEEDKDHIGTTESVDLGDHSGAGSNGQEFPGDNSSHDPEVGLTTEMSTTTNVEVVNVSVVTGPESDEITSSEPSV
jgi:hypothetical protein